MRDFCIRKLLTETELLTFSKDKNSKIVEELTLPITKTRIDIAVINGFLHGYEIKSGVDTLNRLPNQIEGYSKVFDYLTVVTEEKHHQKVIKFLPKWIGVIVCSEHDSVKRIKTIRKPLFNNNKNGFYIARLLWHEELVQLFISLDIPFRKKDRSWLLCEQISAYFDADSLSALVRVTLKKRKDWKERLITNCEAKSNGDFD